jgi:hypothetical protein
MTIWQDAPEGLRLLQDGRSRSRWTNVWVAVRGSGRSHFRGIAKMPCFSHFYNLIYRFRSLIYMFTGNAYLSQWIFIIALENNAMILYDNKEFSELTLVILFIGRACGVYMYAGSTAKRNLTFTACIKSGYVSVSNTNNSVVSDVVTWKNPEEFRAEPAKLAELVLRVVESAQLAELFFI